MDLILLSKALGRAIQEDERYFALIEARKANDEDEELQDAIGAFNLNRLELNNEMNKVEDGDKEKMKQLNQVIHDLYNEIMSNEHMKAYNEAKQAADAMMNQLNQVLVAAINGEDLETLDFSEGCSGSCESCSGCGQ